MARARKSSPKTPQKGTPKGTKAPPTSKKAPSRASNIRSRKRTSAFLDLETETEHLDDDFHDDALPKRTKNPSEPAAKDVLEINVEGLTVSELKEELRARGLPTEGLKSVLRDRLLEAVAETGCYQKLATSAAPKQSAAGASLHSSAKTAAAASDAFDIEAFLASDSTPQSAPSAGQAGPVNYDNKNKTMVGFMVEQGGSVKCLDPAFPGEFERRAQGQEFATTKQNNGVTHFTFARGGDVRLTRQSILSQCNNEAQKYMEQTVKPLLNTYGFEPVVQGVYTAVQLELKLQRLQAGGFEVTGDTGYVVFNNVFNFRLAKWKWDKEGKRWILPQDVIDSACGYNGDVRSALKQLTMACEKHGSIKVI